MRGIAFASRLTVAMAALALVAAPTLAQRGVRTLDARTQAALVAALDEERKAEATYKAVIARFGPVVPFASIVRSEGVHAQRVAELLVRYGVPVPANNWDAAGSVTAPATLREAYLVGIAVEREDIALYDSLLPTIAQRDISNVFSNLRSASFSHLAAFVAAASR